MTNNRRQASRLFINKSFQTKVILMSSGVGLLVSVAYGLVFYTLIKDNYEILVDLSPMVEASRDVLRHELHQMMLFLIMGTVLFLVATVWFAIFLSHRTAGPLYQMKMVFEAVARGERGRRISVRSNDDFQDVAEAANRALDILEVGSGKP
jgi:methyl-accepting chemotaxis protein